MFFPVKLEIGSLQFIPKLNKQIIIVCSKMFSFVLIEQFNKCPSGKYFMINLSEISKSFDNKLVYNQLKVPQMVQGQSYNIKHYVTMIIFLRYQKIDYIQIVIGSLHIEFSFLCGSELNVNRNHRTLFNYRNKKLFLKTCKT